jgi:hypothetical protein
MVGDSTKSQRSKGDDWVSRGFVQSLLCAYCPGQALLNGYAELALKFMRAQGRCVGRLQTKQASQTLERDLTRIEWMRGHSMCWEIGESIALGFLVRVP